MFAKEYFFYSTLGVPFYMFGQAMNPIIRSDGSPKFAMLATDSGAITNVILDPLFIYGFHWGMMGAAVATILGQVLTAALSVWYLRHIKVIQLQKSSFRLDWGLIPKFLVLGLTSFLAQISLVISMAAVQNICMKYGAKDSVFGQPEYAQIPLSVLGIVMKFFQIAISIAIGMAAGCIPIAGYNIGTRPMQAFYSLTGIRFVLFDAAFHKLTSCPGERCAFCRLMHDCSKTRGSFRRSDHHAFAKCAAADSPIIYHCHAGLVEAVIPLHENETIIGYLIFGQITDRVDKAPILKKPDYRENGCGIDRRALGSAIQAITCKSREDILLPPRSWKPAPPIFSIRN